MVKRFDIGEECSGIGCWMVMILRPDGEYVTYADYTKLKAKADALESALDFYAYEYNDSGRYARIALAQHGKNTK